MGAGTASANAAFQLADRGLAVVLVERRAMAEAGARWHNGVLDWQFGRAGLEPPSGTSGWPTAAPCTCSAPTAPTGPTAPPA